MAKDILLYGTINEYSTAYFFDQIAEATDESDSEELILRVNCEGGNPDYGTSIIEKIQELADQMSVKVGGMAHSMALFLLAYIETSRVECIESTKAVLHRAAYSTWFEDRPDFKGSLQEQILVKMNKDLEKALRGKINVEELEALPQMKERNLKLKDIFSLEKREEILLTAQDLKKLKLVNKINKLAPTKESQAKAQMEAFRKCRSIEEFKIAANVAPEDKSEPEKPIDMTREELKTKFPELYAVIYAEGKTAGVTEGAASEKRRVEGWMAWAAVDKSAVDKGIAEGRSIEMADISQFSAKMANAQALKDVKEDSAEENKTLKAELPKGDKPKTEKEKALAEFEAGVDKELGLNKEKPKASFVLPS